METINYMNGVYNIGVMFLGAIAIIAVIAIGRLTFNLVDLMCNKQRRT